MIPKKAARASTDTKAAAERLARAAVAPMEGSEVECDVAVAMALPEVMARLEPLLAEFVRAVREERDEGWAEALGRA